MADMGNTNINASTAGPNPDRSGETIDFSAVPPASLLRAAADGELDAEGDARLTDHLDAFPTDNRRVAFDRGLKAACAKTMAADMADAAVPAGLAERVRASLSAGSAAGSAAETSPESAHEADAGSHRFADAIAERSAETRERSFWNSTPMRALGAIAAVLVIAVSATFALRGATGPADGPSGYAVQLAQFVSREHNRVAEEGPAAAAKFRTTAEADAIASITGTLGTELTLPSCELGSLRFGGGSACRVPGDGPSSHFRYFVQLPGAADSVPAIPVSVFIKQDTGEIDLTPGTTYRVDTAACGVSDASIYVLERQGLVYVIVAGGGAADGCTRVLDAMGVAPPTAQL